MIHLLNTKSKLENLKTFKSAGRRILPLPKESRSSKILGSF